MSYQIQVEERAKKILDLYYNNKDGALAEVFNMAKCYDGKRGDMTDYFWRDVFIAIQKM